MASTPTPPTDFSTPVLVQGARPMRAQDLQAAKETRQALTRELRLLDHQIACLSAHQFFADNPSIHSVELGGNMASDDEGGSYFSWRADCRGADGRYFGNGLDPTDDADEARDVGTDFCEDIFVCMEGFEHKFREEVLTPSNAMRRIGLVRMGEQAYGAWRACAERSAIDSATAEALGEGAGALRV